MHYHTAQSYVRRKLIVLDASLDLILVNVDLISKVEMLTESIEACKKLRASRPTQTLSMEKSPPRIIEEPLCAPSCRKMGSALVFRQFVMPKSRWSDLPGK